MLELKSFLTDPFHSVHYPLIMLPFRELQSEPLQACSYLDPVTATLSEVFRIYRQLLQLNSGIVAWGTATSISLTTLEFVNHSSYHSPL
jgi:hypothetical protein